MTTDELKKNLAKLNDYHLSYLANQVRIKDKVADVMAEYIKLKSKEDYDGEGVPTNHTRKLLEEIKLLSDMSKCETDLHLNIAKGFDLTKSILDQWLATYEKGKITTDATDGGDKPLTKKQTKEVIEDIKRGIR